MPDKEVKTGVEPGTPHSRDPRLLPHDNLNDTPLAFYGRLAGWAGSILLLGALFWAGIKHALILPIKVVGILALVCLAFWIYTNLAALVVTIKRRGVQSALGSSLFIVLVLGILVLVNYIAGRHHLLRYDVTKTKQYSLSPATKNVLKDLKEPVTITAFISDDYYGADNLRRLLDNYGYASPKVKVVKYDFKTAIDKVREYGAAYDGTMYVECGKDATKKKEEIRGGTEEQITSAILAVSTGEKTRICFLEGHGEAKLMGGAEDKRSLSNIKAILDNQQYQCDPLNLYTMAQPQVPGDCKLLVVAGPQGPVSAKEVEAIKRYVDQGGNLFLLLEPESAQSFAALLQAHGVKPLGGTVSDKGNSAEGRPQILVAFQQAHDTTKGLDYVVLPLSTPLEVENAEPPPAMPGSPPPPAPKAQPLWKTGDTATATAGARGPFTMAVAVDESPQKPQEMPGMPPQPSTPEDNQRRARIIVVGDSDFATDQTLQMLGGPLTVPGRSNLSFTVMAINWLVKNEKLVAIPPKEQPEQPFSATDSQRRFAWSLTLGIIPLLIIAWGTTVWWLRRR